METKRERQRGGGGGGREREREREREKVGGGEEGGSWGRKKRDDEIWLRRQRQR